MSPPGGEPREIRLIEERLIARFCPPLRPEAVRGRLVETVDSFRSARVRTYVAVLVERAVTRRLLTTPADPPERVEEDLMAERRSSWSERDQPVAVGGER